MEKIKVNISSEVAQILKKDMELFKFFKADDEINQNLFINTLIANYYNYIDDEEQKVNSEIKEILKNETNLSNAKINDISRTISNYFLNRNNKDEIFDTALSFKPTKVSEYALNNIEYLLNDLGLSRYFRILFSAYAKRPQYIREKIMFKDKVELLNKAIAEKRIISFSLNNKKTSLKPYKLVYSGEELFNYLICYNDNGIFSFRLPTLTNLIITKDKFILDDITKEKLDKLINMGPQFACDPDKFGEYVIKLTPNGIKKFKHIYIHRPKPYKKEGNIYYFKCAYEQIYQYFFRFGKDAYVISPAGLSKRLRIEFKEASKHYSSEFNLINEGL